MNIYAAAAAALVACVPGMAAAQESTRAPFEGARVEARLGYETPTVSGDGDVYKIGSAVSYGAEAGYDIAVSDTVVVGPYAVYELSNVKLCDAGACIKVDGNFAAGGRIGFAASPTAQVYAKVGYAKIDLSANVAGLAGSDSKGGIQGAIGAQFNLQPHVYVMVEANYGDYGKLYDAINLQRRHVAAGIGFRF